MLPLSMLLFSFFYSSLCYSGFILHCNYFSLLLLAVSLFASFTFLSPSITYHLLLTLHLLLLVIMSVKRTQSNRKGVSTVIRHKTSPQPPTVTTAHFTAEVGNRVTRGRVSSRPSSLHLTPSASASASVSASLAPSSVSTYSQDVNPPPVQWDFPTDHLSDISPALITRKKGRAKVHLLSFLPSVYSSPPHSFFNTEGEANELLDSPDLILPG